MLITEEELRRLTDQHGITLKGVFHVGAHECEELELYNNLGVASTDIIWVEAIYRAAIAAKRRGIANIYNAVITDTDDDIITFNVSNNGQSSSILDLHTHLTEHPDIHYVDSFEADTITVDTFFERNKLDPSKYNMWNFDIQGAELLALKGATHSLKHVDVLYLEVNEKELYKGCGLIGEIDDFVSLYGFKRIETRMLGYGWGDAVYIKSSLTTAS